MFRNALTAACLAALLSAGAAFAQTPAPATAAPATTAPATTAPAAAPVRPAPRPAVAPAPTGAKVNLNTATASELDGLPLVGKARSKVILDERAKSPFKDWADFDKRTLHTSVNAGVKAKIKDSVTF